jgi:hypothetical protein
VEVCSHRHASHGIECTHGDFAIVDELCDVRQVSIGGIALSGVVL